MSISDLLKEKGIDTSNLELVNLLQSFYQEGYLQGANDGSPNYKYHTKYYDIVARLLDLFKLTQNSNSLEQLKLCLDNIDKFRKENFI